MKVTIWSLLSEESSGTLELNVLKSDTGGHLVKIFCEKKGINVEPDYVLWKKGNVLLDASKTLAQEYVNDGDTLMFTTKDKENEYSYFTSSWWTMVALTLIIGVTGLAYSLYLYLGPFNTSKQFGIVIDAGSSHSHLFLFAWNSQQVSGTEDVEIIHECYMPGGIAQFANYPEGLTPYFLPCLDEAEKLVVSSARATTPLILGATAGMRVLREYDPEGAEAVLSSIRKVFWSNTNFRTEIDDVSILSGTQEGIDGWTAINYLFDNFLKKKNKTNFLSALDLGGASVEISTTVNVTSHWPTHSIYIFNETYNVFSKSFLCYGIVKAHYRYDYLLTQSNLAKPGVISNPCLPVGRNSTFTKRDELEPCIWPIKDKPRDLHEITPGKREWNHIIKYNPELQEKIVADSGYFLNGSFQELSSGDLEMEEFSRKSEVLFTFLGSSDATLCKKRISSLFNGKLCEKTFAFGDCLSHRKVPSYSGQLVGFSSVFFRVLPLLKIRSNSSLSDFEALVSRTCSMSYDKLRRLHPDVSPVILEDLCFDGMYVYLLLTQGLGVTPDKWKSVLFAKEVGHQDISWPLGLMLNRTTYIPMPKIETALDPISFILMMTLFGACLLTSCLFVFNICKVDRKIRSYERIVSFKPEERPFITS